MEAEVMAMRLLSALPSPFGRKVKIVAAIKGLSDAIAVELVDTTAPDTSALRTRPQTS